MLRLLPGPVRAILSLLFYVVNTLFWGLLIFPLALVKKALPAGSWRRGGDRLVNAMAERWISVNKLIQRLLCPTRWNVRMSGPMEKDAWYLVLANHQSWVDILVLQRVFHRKIPFLKFFIKRELLWLPVLGQVWWIMDFPFLKRHSKQFLKKHPDRIGEDLDITKRACEKFKTVPISIMNFVEGTRFSTEKRRRQESPYTHLLKTRAGGIAYVLSAMGDRMKEILDVTIVYPKGRISFWGFLCGHVPEIRVAVQSYPVTADLVGDYARDREFRVHFHRWLNALWSEKDRRMERMLTEPDLACSSGSPAPAFEASLCDER